jgi:GT2 family glycosyltransferase
LGVAEKVSKKITTKNYNLNVIRSVDMINNCAVIVVTYNGKKEWYDKCFRSLLTSSVSLKIIVIDNNSTDDTVDYIHTHFPEIKIIENDTNYGFARANNIGLKIAYENNTNYYFLLNQDAWVERNTIEELIKFSEDNTEYGIMSPIHLTGDKKHFDKNFLNWFNRAADTLHAYEDLFLNKSENHHYGTRFVNAAAWLITKKCLETVGGFDTIAFKHYGEDNNYCQRVLYHDFKIAIVTSVTICHDREVRQSKPSNLSIEFANIYTNLLLGPKDYVKQFLKMMIKIMSVKYSRKGCKELFFLMKNIQKIRKSRQIGKAVGEGMQYIFNA